MSAPQYQSRRTPPPSYGFDPMAANADPMDEDAAPRELSYEPVTELPPVHNRQPTVPPIGLYVVRLEGIYRETENRYNPEYERMRFDWVLLGIIDSNDGRKAQEFIGQTVHSWCNKTMGPSATLRRWSEALLQRQLEDEEQVPIAELIGKVVKASYVAYEKSNGTPGVKLGALSPYVPDQVPPSRSAPGPAAARPNPQRQAPPPQRRQPAPALTQDEIDARLDEAFDGAPAAESSDQAWDRYQR